jgi:hypothetical protein
MCVVCLTALIIRPNGVWDLCKLSFSYDAWQENTYSFEKTGICMELYTFVLHRNVGSGEVWLGGWTSVK